MTVSPFTAADYIQLACAGQHSALIELQRAGAPAGRIVIRAGELWHAEDARGSGLDALRRLLFLAQCEVNVGVLDPARAGARTLQGPWQAIMLDAARSHDEHVRASTAPPAALEAQSAGTSAARAAVRVPVRARAAGRPALLAIEGGAKVVSLSEHMQAVASSQLIRERFNTLLERAVEALLERRLREAYELFTQAAVLEPNDPRVRANLTRLGELGFSGGST